MHFIMTLYDGSSPYVTCALEKIRDLRKVFDCRFIIILDMKTAEECIHLFQEKYIDIQIIKSKNNKATVIMRFKPLFDIKYADSDMIIIDTHDETSQIVLHTKKSLCKLNKTSKDVLFMYVVSPDNDCIYNASLHKTFHSHRDAGFSVWKKNTETRNMLSKKFDMFIDMLVKTYAKYEYGADEVLMDVFFSDISKNKQLLQKNVFPSCPCHNKLSNRKFNIITPDMIETTLNFTGEQEMYICARKDFL